MSDSSYMLDLLRSLRETGADGFEGLIRTVIEAWTGERFFLCSGGRQEGKDLSNVSLSSAWLAVECKRYGSNRTLDERELLGELAQADRRAHGGLDLWILAASREVPEQLVTSIRYEAQSRGISTLVLDTRASSGGALGAFVARYSHLLKEHLESRAVPFDGEKLEGAIQSVRSHRDRVANEEAISRELSDLIGYEGMRRAAREWLVKSVSTVAASKRAFAQKLDVRSSQSTTVVRHGIHKSLSAWFSSWSKEDPVRIVTGEEGSGKTWACIDWLLSKQEAEPDFPLSVVSTYNRRESPLQPEELLATSLSPACSPAHARRLTERLRSWARRTTADRPLIFLLIDGADETPGIEWSKLLGRLQEAPWSGRVAIAITAREGHVLRRLKDLTGFDSDRLISIGGYSDRELEVVLAGRNLCLEQIPAGMKTLVRRPRYCDLVCRHFKQLTASSDLTVARLIYEDWRDRFTRKQSTPIDDTQFRQILADAADLVRRGECSLNEAQISRMIPDWGDRRRTLHELISGGVFEASSGSVSKPYRVEGRRLVQGLGALLYDRLLEADRRSRQLDLELAEWLEPHAEIDLKTQIIGSAMFFAALHDDCSPAVRRQLLRSCLTAQNVLPEDEEAISAYFARMPNLYLELADEVWSEGSDYGAAKSRIAAAILSHVHAGRSVRELVSSIERWMGVVYRSGHPICRSHHPEAVRAMNGLRALLKGDSAATKIDLCGYRLRIVDGDEFRELFRLALLVISAGDRAPFADALVTWALAYSSMSVPTSMDDELDWVARLTDEDLWKILRPKMELLARSPDLVPRKAAHRLAWVLGTEESLRMKTNLEAELYADREPNSKAEAQEDPCTHSVSWSKTDCRECMRRDDLDPCTVARRVRQHALDPEFLVVEPFASRLGDLAQQLDAATLMIGRSRTSADLALEDAEPVLAAQAPNLLAEVAHRIVAQLEERSEARLWGVAHQISEFAPILNPEEGKAIARVRTRVTQDASGWAEFRGGVIPRDMHMEMELFMAEISSLDAAEQLERLVERDAHAYQDAKLECWFRPLEEARARSTLSQLPDNEDVDLKFRTLWFLGANPPTLDARSGEALLQLAKDPAERVRLQAIEWIVRSNDRELNATLATDLGGEGPNCRAAEKHWRSCVRALACPDYLAAREHLTVRERHTFVAIRNWSKEDLSQFADELHHAWIEEAKRGVDAAAAPPYDWEDVPFHHETMIDILGLRPWYVSSWADAALNGLRAQRHWIRHGREFYTALTRALLCLVPGLGAKLWLELERLGQRDLGALFIAPDSDEVEWLRARSLDQMFSDEDLGQLARAASSRGRTDWVLSTARALTTSASTWRKGRGIALAAMADLPESDFAPFDLEMREERTWLGWARNRFLAWHNHNRWARHWFARFLTAVEPEDSWAAFRLFLRCADSRFWGWRDGATQDAGVRASSDRLRFVDWSESEIKSAIKRNESDRQDTFLGTRISKGAIHPFTGGHPYLLSELSSRR